MVEGFGSAVLALSPTPVACGGPRGVQPSGEVAGKGVGRESGPPPKYDLEVGVIVEPRR